MRKKGFTLIELIVVIAIIAILAAIIAPNAFKAIEKAQISKVVGDFKTIKTATMAYYTDTGRWPPSDSSGNMGNITVETNNFVSGTGQPAGWDGPYLERWPNTPFRPSGQWGVQPFYNYTYACCPWGFCDANGGADVYLQASYCTVENAQKIKNIIDGTSDLGPQSYAQQTGAIRWHYTADFIYYIIAENTACGDGDIP